jgi:hypothetical protein
VSVDQGSKHPVPRLVNDALESDQPDSEREVEVVVTFKEGLAEFN